MSFWEFIVLMLALAVIGRALLRLWPRVLRDPEAGFVGQAIGMGLLLGGAGVWILVYGIRHHQPGRILAGSVAIAGGLWVVTSVSLKYRWYRCTGVRRKVAIQGVDDSGRYLVRMGFRDAKPVGVIYDSAAKTISAPIDLDEVPAGRWRTALMSPVREQAVSIAAVRLFVASGGVRNSA